MLRRLLEWLLPGPPVESAEPRACANPEQCEFDPVESLRAARASEPFVSDVGEVDLYGAFGGRYSASFGERALTVTPTVTSEGEAHWLAGSEPLTRRAIL